MPTPSEITEKRLDVSAVVFRYRFLARNAADELATITAGGSPADTVGLDNVNLEAAFGQRDRR
jgi:hypothetical protein